MVKVKIKIKTQTLSRPKAGGLAPPGRLLSIKKERGRQRATTGKPALENRSSKRMLRFPKTSCGFGRRTLSAKGGSSKPGQLETWAAWQTLAADPAAIMKGLQGWLRSESWRRENGRYVPNPAKFLREQRWLAAPSGSAAFGVSDKERFRRQYEKYKGMTLGQIRAMRKREAEGVQA